VTEPADLTIHAARAEMLAGRLSAPELVQAVLERIETRNGELNAYLHVDGERALAEAERADPGAPLGGIPVCVKDVVDVAGLPTRAGAAGWERRPQADAPVVARLREAGAVIVGKGNTNEFAYGIDGRNPHHGDCRNPHDTERITGGSSSGPAAAVAAGLALGGVGTDTSGSLRVPASLCGIVGLRPTRRRVPRAGVVPLAWSYDAVGPMARTATDAAVLLHGMAGQPIEPAHPRVTGREAVGRPLAGLRIGVIEELFDGACEPYVADGVRERLETIRGLGAELAPVAFEYLHHGRSIHRIVQLTEAAAIHEPWFADQAPRYAPDVRGRLETGRLLPANVYLRAQRARRLLVDELLAVMDRERLDALAAPTTPAVAPRRGEETVSVAGAQVALRPALVSLVVAVTESGGPVLAFPAGEHEGLPFGMQLAGRAGAEPTLLAVAAACEAAAG
jgi:aspartyl-tRNA(Asn)/glutamyl-tRNA(Gln) amidotransferase subunit A